MTASHPSLFDVQTWPDLPGEDLITRAVGGPTYARGAAYARAGKVGWQASDPDRRVLFAKVAGGERQAYQTIVQVGDARGRRLSSGHCTCPVGVNCKHVAAVLVAALADLSVTRPPSTPAWESALTEIVAEEQQDHAGVPIGLQFEPVVAGGRPAAPAAGAAAARRPRQEGRLGA